MTPNRLTPEAFRDAPKTQVRVVLENIRSGLNVGAFFRTGDSLRIEGIEPLYVGLASPRTCLDLSR